MNTDSWDFPKDEFCNLNYNFTSPFNKRGCGNPVMGVKISKLLSRQ
jgi:hypothetical protein